MVSASEESRRMRRRVLIVEVFGAVESAVVEGLAHHGACDYSIVRVESERGVEEFLRSERFDAIVIDLARSGAEGLALVRFVAARAGGAAIVVLSPRGALAPQVERLGAAQCLPREGLDVESFAGALERALDQRSTVPAPSLQRLRTPPDLGGLSGERIRVLLPAVASVERAVRELTEPDLRHAERERLAVVLSLEVHRVRAILQGGRAVEAGLSVVEFTEIIRSIELLARHRAAARPIALRVVCAYPIPWGLRCPREGVELVVWDLVEDAVRHTAEGAVTVAFGYLEQTRTVCVSIVDTRGRSRSEREVRLFRGIPAQGEESRCRGVIGRLTRVNRLIQKLGGAVTAEVNPSGGVVWDVRLPAEPVGPWIHSAEEAGVLPKSRAGAPIYRSNDRCLIVDPGVLTRLTLARVLRSLGMSVLTVSSGAQAFEILQGAPFDRLFIDLEDRIVREPYVKQSLRKAGFDGSIVGLTAHGAPSGERIPLHFDGIVSKPISAREVTNVCEMMTLRQHGDRVRAARPASPLDVERSKAAAAAEAELAAVIAGYVAGLPKTVSALAGAVTAREWDQAREIVHHLKAGGAFGYPEVSIAARAVEQAVTAGDLAEIERGTRALGDVVGRLIHSRSSTLPGSQSTQAHS